MWEYALNREIREACQLLMVSTLRAKSNPSSEKAICFNPLQRMNDAHGHAYGMDVNLVTMCVKIASSEIYSTIRALRSQGKL